MEDPHLLLMLNRKKNLLMKSGGFTLMEMIIAISIATAIFAIIAPISVNEYVSEELTSEENNLISILRKAEVQSLANKNQLPHGIYITRGSYTLFEGNSYATRNQSLDEVFPQTTAALSLNGLSEIVFSPITATTTAGTINMVGERKTLVITINSEGSINYY